jgi:hypothetical protein
MLLFFRLDRISPSLLWSLHFYLRVEIMVKVSLDQHHELVFEEQGMRVGNMYCIGYLDKIGDERGMIVNSLAINTGN